MSSKSIKWIKTGIILIFISMINTVSVLADSGQSPNYPTSNFGSKVLPTKGFLNSSLQDADLHAPGAYDGKIDDLSANNDFTTYLPIISAEYCFAGYYDDFSDPNSGWPELEDTDRLLEYKDEEYRILVKNTDIWGGASPGIQVSDYIVTVDVRNVSGVDGSYGIIFQLADDWSTFYTFEIFPDGYYSLWRFEAKKKGWKLLEYQFSEHIKQSTDRNEIQVVRSGDLIRTYANQQLVVEMTESSFTGVDSVGLITSSYDDINVDARFDNFAVNPLDCTGP